MKVFITGVTGYIGNAAASLFRQAGCEVWGLTRNKDKVNELVRQEIRPVIGDLNEPESYRPAASQCQVIIHTARDTRDKAVELEQKTVKMLLEIAASGYQPATLIYTSSVWIYGDTHSRMADETDQVAPVQYVSMLPDLERAVLSAEKVKGLVIRPGMVYGGRGGFTRIWFEEVLQQESLTVIGDAANRLAMVHVQDLANAYLKAAQWGGSGEIFNITDGSAYPIQQLLNSVAKVMEYPHPVQIQGLSEASVRFGALAEILAMDQIIDSGKARAVLGWKSYHRFFVEDAETYYLAWLGYQDKKAS